MKTGKKQLQTSRLLVAAIFAGALFAGCDSAQTTYRDTLNKQNDAFSEKNKADLSPAAPEDKSTVYSGTVHLNDSDQDFDCVVELEMTSEFTRISQGEDQTTTVEVPKLTGSMRFPVLDGISIEDMSSYAALTRPMGSYSKVLFDFGNYNPRSHRMILPYLVPGYSGSSFGELQGTLVGGHYVGTWFSKPFGDVGTFKLTRSQGGGHP